MGIELNIRETKEKPDDSLFQWGLLLGLLTGAAIGGVMGYNVGRSVGPRPIVTSSTTSTTPQKTTYQGIVKEVYNINYNRADNYLPFKVSMDPNDKTPHTNYLIKCIDRPNRGSFKINLSKLEDLIRPEMEITLDLALSLHRQELLIDPTKIVNVGGINRDLLMIKIK